MPFQSVKQERYLWSQHPDMAQRWTDEHGSYEHPKRLRDLVPAPKRKPVKETPRGRRSE